MPKKNYYQEVWDGLRDKTPGGLTKSDLIINKRGKIVSKARQAAAKKNKSYLNLVPYKSSKRRSSRRKTSKRRSSRRKSSKRRSSRRKTSKRRSSRRKSSKRRSSRRKTSKRRSSSRRRSSARRALYK